MSLWVNALKIAGLTIPTPRHFTFLKPGKPAGRTINLLPPIHQSRFQKTQPPQHPPLLTPAPFAHKGIFDPRHRQVANLLSSENSPFPLDRPREATLNTLSENGRIHIVIALSDQDMLRWQAGQKRLWHELAPHEQRLISRQHGQKKIIRFFKKMVAYTVVMRSQLVPATDSLRFKPLDPEDRSKPRCHTLSSQKKKSVCLKAATLLLFAALVPFASLLLPLIFLKRHWHCVSAFIEAGGKARWCWNGKKFDFVMYPGCPYGVDPRDPDTEENLGKENRYYHVFRRHAGVLDKLDLARILPDQQSRFVDKLWELLTNRGYLAPYRARPDEGTVTEKIMADSSGSQLLADIQNLDMSERFLLRELLKSYAWQAAQKPAQPQAVTPPLVTILSSGHIRLLEHHRVFGAMDFGVPIVVTAIYDEKSTLN